MTTSIEELFERGIARYQAGEPAADLIPVFTDICDQAAKNSAAWTCLSWLCLLDGQANAAYKAASKAVKLSPADPQARVNLAIAMLEIGKTGVRQHVERALQVLSIPEAADLQREIAQNFEDGLKRRPDWAALERVRSWMMG